MNISTKELVIFDLDGTLSESKQSMDPTMSVVFARLIAKKKVAVISGGGWPQFEKQFLGSLPQNGENLTNLILLPTSGTRMLFWRGTWCEQYAEHLSSKEKERALIALHDSLKESGYIKPSKIWGEIIEDRGSQITFSALGQSAPITAKSAWDPDAAKRNKIAEILRGKIPGFDVRIGGTTSIDITKKGVNKAYGIRKLEEYLKMSPDTIVFVGDKLMPGGNDYPARATGVDCIQVSGPSETKKLIESWLI